MEILSVVAMRELERLADMNGLRYRQMMQNAGNGAADVIRARIQPGSPVLVLIGPGNNGGDGLVCATALARANANLDVRCWLLKPRDEADAMFATAQSAKLNIALADLDTLRRWLTEVTVIVDALLGTGVSRPIDGVLVNVLHALANPPLHPRPASVIRIALDGPTGMNYDTGALDPATVPVDLTITFHAPKRGHYCYPAAEARGELIVVPIGIEAKSRADFQLPGAAKDTGDRLEPHFKIDDQKSKIVLVDHVLARMLLPSRKLDSNKGSHGRAVVAGGSPDYIGAPILSATAAYRVGAGLVGLVVPNEVKSAATHFLREAIFVPVPAADTAGAHLGHEAAVSLIGFVSKIKDGVAVLIGPGLGQSTATALFVAACTDDDGLRALVLKGLVCDADALNTLATMPEWRALLPSNTVLTPHAGEMSRLSGMSIAEVQGDRIGIALRCAREWGHVVVLKGAYTVIAAPDGRGALLPFANSAMATAGTGDVLAGCIVGLLAQGLSPFDAAVCGGYLHGLAGERWRANHGDAGLLASDLLPLIPDVIHEIKSQNA